MREFVDFLKDTLFDRRVFIEYVVPSILLIVIIFFLYKPYYDKLPIMSSLGEVASLVKSRDVDISYFSYVVSTFSMLALSFVPTVIAKIPWWFRTLIYIVFFACSLNLYVAQNQMMIADVDSQKQQRQDIEKQISVIELNNKVNKPILDKNTNEIESLKQRINELETRYKK